ncbi:MAG TPA: MerR family transcriptional regulator [Candidatus Omnitrophota bacterium]|nr:MerR family transcriptional regulator [Candidatus Omnitrophota bacterium]HRZ14522.1 MerR family transcriptional regulator [Candidatus Omnitrophota bacterium]
MENKYITVKEISGKYGLSYQVINRYSDAGLLSVAFKKGNVRFYERKDVVKRMSVISKLTREGYSLMLIRKQLTGF